MGDFRLRDCYNCKNLFDAVSIGVCEVTDHQVIKTGDSEKAEECKHFSNKYYRDEE